MGNKLKKLIKKGQAIEKCVRDRTEISQKKKCQCPMDKNALLHW
jgi:hypothetical protein